MNPWTHLTCITIIFAVSTAQAEDWKTLLEAKKNIMGDKAYNLLNAQYTSFAQGQTLKIADPVIKAITIVESHEPIVDINKYLIGSRIKMLPTPTHPFASPDHNSGYAAASKMRETVARKLQDMVTRLDALAHEFGYKPGQVEIKVFEALRDITTQEALFENKKQEIKAANPNMSDEDAFQETCKWVSPVRNNVPVHSTGGAVDIRLWDNHQQQFIDMGLFGVIWGNNSSAPTFSPNLTDEQKKNRCYILAAATQAGLVNYVYEWWHFSSGDRYAAYWQEHDCTKRSACYGAVN